MKLIIMYQVSKDIINSLQRNNIFTRFVHKTGHSKSKDYSINTLVERWPLDIAIYSPHCTICWKPSTFTYLPTDVKTLNTYL